MDSDREKNKYGGAFMNLKYRAEEGRIVRNGGEYYYNRPMYFANIPGTVISGDKPAVKLMYGHSYMGQLFFGIRNAEGFRWMHALAGIETSFLPAKTEWRTDAIRLTVMPDSRNPWALVCMENTGKERVECYLLHTGMNNDDRIEHAANPMWYSDPTAFPKDNLFTLLKSSFCEGNRACVEADGYEIVDRTGKNRARGIAFGKGTPYVCSSKTVYRDRAPISSSRADAACIRSSLESGERFCAVICLDERRPADFQRRWEAALARSLSYRQKANLVIPDAELREGAPFAVAAVDGAYNPSVYLHGAMAWNHPFPGWHTLLGGTVFGDFDRVKAECAYFLAYQKREGECSRAAALPEVQLGTLQTADSVFYGRGKIDRDQNMYDFQSLYFDQLVHAYEWSGDEELRGMLEKGLPLHLDWQKNCFDPQDSGLYESYINTWPTDTIWNNGGKGCEETAFAYHGYRVGEKIVRDPAVKNAYRLRADRIKKAFLDELWISEKGHPAFYRDEIGNRMLHEDAWLWSIVLPADNGLLDEKQRASALYYTEWGLERVPQEDVGGERVYLSNYVPYMWSTRTLSYAEEFALANVYFKTGLFDEGYRLFRTCFLQSMYNLYVPGGLGTLKTSTDFTDISTSFARTLVEGLFGYRPDYPHGKVLLAPSVPSGWLFYSASFSAFSYEYREEQNCISLKGELDKEADLTIELPLAGRRLVTAACNGRDADGTVRAGFDQNFLVVHCGKTSVFSLKITMEGERRIISALNEELHAGDPVAATGEIDDPQGALRREAGTLYAAKAGYFLVFERQGDVIVRRKLHVTEEECQRCYRRIPEDALFYTQNISAHFNGRLRDIFKQKYLTPRVKTCSAQIGVDGFSPWTAVYWNVKPPRIDECMLTDWKLGPDFMTPQGVPFRCRKGGGDIAFTSLYDNYPDSVEIALEGRARAVWVLVGGSTNPMQTNLANARLEVFYRDGGSESLDLIPPKNFWSVCGYRETDGRGDYRQLNHRWPMGEQPPEIVKLGRNCDTCLVNLRVDPMRALTSIKLTCLANEVVIGILGVTLMK